MSEQSITELNAESGLSRGNLRLSERVDGWIESHIELLAILALGAGFIVRVVVARSRYLVADEALDYLLVNQPSALAAYRASLTQAHPPLFYFVLYYWRFLGTSELMLRFPSIIAGTLMPWFAFLWLKRLGKDTAFLALLLLTFTPPVVTFSTEIRPYGFLLLFVVAALWSLDRGFERNSAGDMVVFGALLCLALFMQYSAIWVAIAAGIYALARIVSGELKKAAVFGWIASQACALAVLGFLWVTHISTLYGGVMESSAVKNYLSAEYFQAGENVLRFVSRTGAGAFLYLLNRHIAWSLDIPRAGIAIALFFLFAIVLVLANCTGGMKAKVGSTRTFGVLLLLPVIVGCAGALLQFYPYGSSRHVAYLEPFVMAAIAFGLAFLSQKAFWAGIVATVVLLITCNVYSEPAEYMSTAGQAKKEMVQTVKYIHESVPAGGVILVDYNTGLMLRYYLCSGAQNSIRGGEDRVEQFACGEYQMASGVTRNYGWVFSSKTFVPLFAGMEKQLDWSQGQAIWLVQADEISPPLDLTFLARFGAERTQEFGEYISVTRLRAP